MSTKKESDTLHDKSNVEIFDVSLELTLISKIRENQVLDLASKQLMPRSMYTSFYRTFVTQCESRQSAFDYFRSVYNSAFDLLMKLRDEGRYDEMGRIKSKIEESFKGVENHSKTYFTDTLHVSKIQTLIESTTELLKKFITSEKPYY